MPRRKLSEYKAKSLVAKAIGINYVGWSITPDDIVTPHIEDIYGYDRYVVKVDQAVKGRFKKGLVLLNVATHDILAALETLKAKGYSYFLIEPFVVHGDQQERYLSLTYDRDGTILSYSDMGGIDIDMHQESVQTRRVTDTTDLEELERSVGISKTTLGQLLYLFESSFFTFMEINPYIVKDDTVVVLDCAVEVDDAGRYFTTAWNVQDLREANTTYTKQELAVRELNERSAASFSLSVLNPQGSLFLLLSGGGASVVVADEVYMNGLGDELANYGEYSGNPSQDETQLYTDQIIDLLLESKAPKKVLFIGGAIANFTDVEVTFAGIIDAIQERADALRQQDVTVYVRRGGPNQEKALRNMTRCLERYSLLGGVYGSSTTLVHALSYALKELGK